MIAAGVGGGWWLGSQAGVDLDQVPRSSLGLEAEQRGLARAIPGWTDTLLVVATNGSEAMDLVMWPPAGPLAIRPQAAAWTAVTLRQRPFDEFAAFDSSGRHIALAAPVAREESVVLLAGRLEESAAVASSVTSYAWHVTEPHSLAFIVDDGTGSFLELMRGAPRAAERFGVVPSGARIVAWGDWGFVVATEDGLEAIGSQSRIEGRFVAAGPDGVIVAAGNTLSLWDPASGAAQPVSGPADAVIAAFAPDGDSVAIATPERIVIVDRAGETVYETAWSFVESLAWSSDGRHLIFADRVDVYALDLDSQAVIATGLGPSVAVAVRR